MWKWIIGAVVLVVLLIGSGVWYGLRKMTQFANGDSTVVMTIGGTPDRVFASLASGDSIGDWMVGGRVRPSRSGPLRKGDTLYVDSRSGRSERLKGADADSTVVRNMSWVVGEVVPDDRFQARFDEYCQSLTNLSPITARLTKRVVRGATRLADAEAHFRYELQSIRRAFESEDGKEARQAFGEKRPPVFEGR